MKADKKFNRGAIALVIVLFAVAIVAFYNNAEIEREKKSAQEVVYKALDGYVKYRIIPQDIRDLYYKALNNSENNDEPNNGDIWSSVFGSTLTHLPTVKIDDLDFTLDNYLSGYRELLNEIIYDSESEYQSERIKNMVSDAKESLKKHFNVFVDDFDGSDNISFYANTYLISNIIDNYEFRDCTDTLVDIPTDPVFNMNSKHTEATMKVKYEILYGENTYETVNTFRLINTKDKGWQIFDTYLIITSIR